jgi:hypothetical protein
VCVLAAVACSADDPPEPAPVTTAAPDGGPGTAAGPSTTEAVDPALELCMHAERVEPAPEVAADELVEISGVAASTAHEGVLWVHNDSGGAAAVWAVGADGEDLGSWTLEGAENRDWEDIAIGPGLDGEPALYVADIGDNLAQWSELVIYRFPEPDPTTGGGTVAPDQFVLRYPDGAHDAETFMVDQTSGELVIVVKGPGFQPAAVFRAPADLADRSQTTLERVGEIDLSDLGPLATGGEAGDAVVALRTYTKVLLWGMPPGVSVAQALVDGRPCETDQTGEPQGEAVAVLPGDGGYVTISEGGHPPINRFEIPG